MSNETKVINQSHLRTVTLIIDNTEGWLNRINEAAVQAVINDADVMEPTGEDFLAMLTGRGASKYDRNDYVEAVGLAVEDAIEELVDEALPDTMSTVRLLLIDLLDLRDRSFRDMLGDHYFPEEDQVRAAL